MTPYRRPTLHPSSGCMAIAVPGERCNRRHFTEIPVMFAWDPVLGVGVGGPSITLCRMHNYLWSLPAEERVHIVGGWMGRAWNNEAEVWTVMTTVYETADGLDLSKVWWAQRRTTRFGQTPVDVAFDAALAGMEIPK